MTLPDLEWQIAYSRIGWAVVFTALAVAALAWRSKATRTRIAMIGIALWLAQWLPGGGSPAYWLGLAFQFPSGLMVALCALSTMNHWLGQSDRAVLPIPLAVVVVAAGAVLYLDASGWMAQGLYFPGFGPHGAPVVALLLGSVCVLAALAGRRIEACHAVLFSVALFAVLRLPTGNLWDALLDPFLWIWSLVVCTRAARSAFVLRNRRVFS